MSSQSERKSPEELKQQHQALMAMAAKAQATVLVTDSNWKTLINSQQIQVDMLTQILEKLGTLTTDDQLVEYMERQMEILQQHAEESIWTMEQYQQTLMESVQSTTRQIQQAADSMEKQAGNVSEKFGQAISQESLHMKQLTKRLCWIALILSLLFLVLELTPLIWRLIFPA